MGRLSHYLPAFVVLCLFANGKTVWAEDTQAALHHERESYAKDFAQTVVTILHDHKQTYEHRKDILRQSFVNSVDVDWIAKFALGHAWKNATEEQRERYTSLYRKFLTETYVTKFAENPEKSIYSIKIMAVDDDNPSEFTVHTHMLLMDNENLSVDYRIFDSKGSYRVRDFVIENVSLITTHRAEFTELADAKGVEGVIKTLQDRLTNKQVASLAQ